MPNPQADQDDSSVHEHIAKLATACRILEMEGHGDMAQGHLSWRDPKGRGFWMKRNDIGLGEVLGLDDFILLDFKGAKLSGPGRSHSEWPIHSEIMLERPDINVVAHTHPIHACVLSASKGALRPFTLDADKVRHVPRYEASGALVNDAGMGRDIAKALGRQDAIFLANHGVTFCGATIEYAVCIGIFLEKACRVELMGAGVTLDWAFPSAADREVRHGQMMTEGHIAQSWAYFRRKLQARAGAGAPTPVYG